MSGCKACSASAVAIRTTPLPRRLVLINVDTNRLDSCRDLKESACYDQTKISAVKRFIMQ